MDKYYVDETGRRTLKRGGKSIDLGTVGKYFSFKTTLTIDNYRIDNLVKALLVPSWGRPALFARTL
jgi:hypothetical protein